jgi:hypothetical protein
MIRSRFQGMYWLAHKTATLTSFQRTVLQGINQRGNSTPWKSVK